MPKYIALISIVAQVLKPITLVPITVLLSICVVNSTYGTTSMVPVKKVVYKGATVSIEAIKPEAFSMTTQEQTEASTESESSKNSILSTSAAQSAFEEATLDLEQARFKSALEKYKAIEHSEFYSGGLFLNMAIAAVEIDSLGLAKFYLQKAIEEPNTAAAAVEALAYVESQFSRQAATLPPLPWETFLDNIQDNWSGTWLFWVGFIFLNSSVALLLLHWFANQSNHSGNDTSTQTKSLFQKSSVVALLIGLLFFSLAYGTDYRSARYSEAVIVAQETEIRTEPNESSEIVVMGYEGYDCRIDHSVDGSIGWRFIRLSNGQTGWILEQALRSH